MHVKNTMAETDVFAIVHIHIWYNFKVNLLSFLLFRLLTNADNPIPLTKNHVQIFGYWAIFGNLDIFFVHLAIFRSHCGLLVCLRAFKCVELSSIMISFRNGIFLEKERKNDCWQQQRLLPMMITYRITRVTVGPDG